MGIKLESPCIMASITLMSNVNIEKHVEYYLKVIQNGSGAIVLPSVNPKKQSFSNSKVEASCLPLKTGLKRSSNMAFSVLGPTSNLVSVEYIVELINNLIQKNKTVPIIGSIANIGTEEEILKAVEILNQTEIKGIELNFSCPNVLTKKENENTLTIDLLRNIRKKTRLPISLKLSPNFDYSTILPVLSNEIDSLTVSNAFIGLVPPNLKSNVFSPFCGKNKWAPSGIYGPYEKMLTFYNLFSIGNILAEKGWDVACVGGLVNANDVLQAIYLGADVVGLSSVIAWDGVSSFIKIKKEIIKYMDDNKISSLNEMKGKALSSIYNSADEISNKFDSDKMKVDMDLCRSCNPCLCCDKMCVAISQDNQLNVSIDAELCSGCRWCYYICPNKAIVKDETY